MVRWFSHPSSVHTLGSDCLGNPRVAPGMGFGYVGLEVMGPLTLVGFCTGIMQAGHRQPEIRRLQEQVSSTRASARGNEAAAPGSPRLEALHTVSTRTS